MADDAGLIVGIVALLLVLGLCAAAAFYLYKTNFFAPKPPPPKPRSRRRSSSRDGSVGTRDSRRSSHSRRSSPARRSSPGRRGSPDSRRSTPDSRRSSRSRSPHATGRDGARKSSLAAAAFPAIPTNEPDLEAQATHLSPVPEEAAAPPPAYPGRRETSDSPEETAPPPAWVPPPTSPRSGRITRAESALSDLSPTTGYSFEEARLAKRLSETLARLSPTALDEFAKASRDPQKLDPIHNDPRASFEERRLASLRLKGGVPTPSVLPPLSRGQRVRHDTKEGYVVEARGDLYDVALDGGRVVSVPRSELEPIHRRLSSSGDEKVPDAPPPVEARLSSLTYSEPPTPLPVEAPPPAYAVPLPVPAESAPAPAPVYARAATPPVAEAPRAATPPSYAAPAPAPAAAALPPRAPTPPVPVPSYARAATPPVAEAPPRASTPPVYVAPAPAAAAPPPRAPTPPAPIPSYARAATPPVAELPPRAPTPPSYARAATPPVPNGREECVVCGRSTAADACSPWNVLTCDVPGCGNEVHTYCTLANPIEEFTCPKCVEKKSLTKHPSLDARIAQRREEFKY